MLFWLHQAHSSVDVHISDFTFLRVGKKRGERVNADSLFLCFDNGRCINVAILFRRFGRNSCG